MQRTKKIASTNTVRKTTAIFSATILIIIAAMAAVLLFLSPPMLLTQDAQAHCDSTDEPPFKEFPGESGPRGNPHTCEQPTLDPHDDPDNNQEGNPHNTE